MRLRRIILSLAALAATAAAVLPAVAAVDAHSAPLGDAPFGASRPSASSAALADPAVGAEWRAVALARR